MTMQKSKLLIKSLSNNNPKPKNWRTQIKTTNLTTQISSILLQRHNWPSLLKPLNLNSSLTPSLFLQILNTIKTQPQISLLFYNWAIKNTSFKPDIDIQCKLTHLLIGSGFVNPSKPILDSLINNYPSGQIAEKISKNGSFFGLESVKAVFDCVIGLYCEKGLWFDGLEVFRVGRGLVGNGLFSISSCNALLDCLEKNDEVKLGLCFYGVTIRYGVLSDLFTWRIVAKICSKMGKVDGVLRIIDMGVRDSWIYDLAIECCSEMGMFEVAFHLFDEMSKRKLNPGFNTCVSILNGACRYKNDEVVKFMMEYMAEKGYVTKPLIEYDSLIRKLCDMRKTYAAYMLFKIACDVEKSLENKTFGCMLQALCIENRLKETVETYNIIEHKGIQVNPIVYNEFITVLCNEDPSKEFDVLLIDMISRGYKPSSATLSKYITSQYKKRRWKVAEELAGLALRESIFLEASCCGFLVKYYCETAQISLAVTMHDQMEKMELTLDSTTYNVLLSGLVEALRVKEAERIFNYMRIKNLLTSESFVIMINAFCRENELKKGMKLHDEMVEMQLKPNPKTYKRLISSFR